MNDLHQTYQRGGVGARPMDMSVDAGLRAFMLGVYNKLGLGLVLSGALAYVTSTLVPGLLFQQVMVAPGVTAVGYTPLGMVVAFAPLALLFGSMFFMRNPSPAGASFLYWAVVALIGASLGAVGLRYTNESIAQVFFITAAAFFALSFFGYTTKRNLSGIGSFLIMGVVGVIIAMVVNMFLQSPALMFAISVIGVLVFAGLIAYDTQRLKVTYYQLGGDTAGLSVATSYGALSLYINVINLFQFLLMLLGQRQ